MYEMSQRHPVWVTENHVKPCNSAEYWPCSPRLCWNAGSSWLTSPYRRCRYCILLLILSQHNSQLSSTLLQLSWAGRRSRPSSSFWPLWLVLEPSAFVVRTYAFWLAVTSKLLIIFDKKITRPRKRMASPTIFCDKGIGMPWVWGGGGVSVKMFQDNLHNFLSGRIFLFCKIPHYKERVT